MSNQAEIDYEKQFQEDLAKATALSLETQALDEYRRSKTQYSYLDRTSSADSSFYRKPPETEIYSQSRIRPGSFNVPNSTSIAPPPAVPSRRHSEIRLPDETSTTRTAESDLISFASPTSVNKPDGSTFDRLIEDIQKLSSAPPPVQAVPSFQNFGSTPSYLNHQVNAGAGGLQLVPFTPAQQKAPLTNEELQKLYNMPPAQVMHSPAMGFTRPAHYAPNFPVQYPQRAAISAGYGYAGAPVSYGFQYGMHRPPPQMSTQQSYPPTQMASNLQHQPPSASEIPIQNVSNPSSALVLQSQPNPMLQITKSQSLSGVSSVAALSSIRSSSSNGINRRPKKTLGDDLIDLSQEDPSRVSVLEAFDPLLNEDYVWKK